MVEDLSEHDRVKLEQLYIEYKNEVEELLQLEESKQLAKEWDDANYDWNHPQPKKEEPEHENDDPIEYVRNLWRTYKNYQADDLFCTEEV